MVTESPYRTPAKLDLSRVNSLLAARASAAEDHLWALREDPGYYSKILLEASEHLPETLKELSGNRHSLLKADQHGRLWSRVIVRVVRDAYLDLKSFSDLSNQAGDLVQLRKMYEGQIEPSKD